MIPEDQTKADASEVRRLAHNATMEAIKDGKVVGPSVIEVLEPPNADEFRIRTLPDPATPVTNMADNPTVKYGEVRGTMRRVAISLEAGTFLKIEDQYGCEYVMEVESAEPLTDSRSENGSPNIVYVKGKSRKLSEGVESARS